MGRSRLERVRIDPDALRAARLRAGYSQSQLARRLGVAEGHTISAWERGQSGPLPSMIPRLARALRVKPEALLTAPEGGPTLHWLRLRAGLSLDVVAARASISKTTYRRLELGEFIRLPDEGVVAALGGALGVSTTAVHGALRASAQEARQAKATETNDATDLGSEQTSDPDIAAQVDAEVAGEVVAEAAGGGRGDG